MKIASPQALAIYRLLQSRNHLTANEISAGAGMLPNAVYRACGQLIRLGVVQKNEGYPVRFSTVPYPAAAGWFLVEAQRAFKSEFGLQSAPVQATKGPTMSFMRTRDNLLAKTDNDTRLAQREIDFVVSGLEVPANTVQVYQQAVARGVKIRALLQKRHDTSPATLRRWLNIAVEVRYTDDLQIRMFLFDSKIAYLTSYSQNRKEDAFGLRFDYAPLTVMLSDTFEQKWQSATPITN